jgi:HPt (histidine-containing phosphotransfer) domain-containing protein
MGDVELLSMLATESDRRAPAVIEAINDLAGSAEPDAKTIEEVRVEIHGLKGAASVVGATRLAELAQGIEIALVQRTDPGTISPELASAVIDATTAFRDGARAASRGEPEPASVAAGIAALADA